ncbi:MAG: UbiD family decarboxylase [Thermoplasmatota archaeon]
MEFRDLLFGSEHRVLDTPVDPFLEAAKISMEDQRKAWIAPAKDHEGLFLAGNVLSTREALAKALGTSKETIPDIMIRGMENAAPFVTVDKPGVYREIDVDSIPIPTYYRTDGGPYITSGIFHAGRGGKFNLSFHRMMYMGEGKFAVRVVPRHLNALLKEAEEAGQGLRAAVSMGTDPAALLAGSVTLPYGKDEMEVASSLSTISGSGVLKVFSPVDDPEGPKAPVGTEVVLYGMFTGERAKEGPFVDVTSTIDLSGMEPGEPVFQVERALIRDGGIVHVLLPGGFEHYMMMGIPKEPSIIQSVKKVVPKVRAVRLTEGGCCWLHGVVSISKQKEGDGKNAIMAAFSGHPSMKKVVVVDDDIDIFDDTEVEWAIATRFQAGRDMVLIEKARGSTLDPSANPEDNTTAKLGLDATMPLNGRERFRKVDDISTIR